METEQVAISNCTIYQCASGVAVGTEIALGQTVRNVSVSGLACYNVVQPVYLKAGKLLGYEGGVLEQVQVTGVAAYDDGNYARNPDMATVSLTGTWSVTASATATGSGTNALSELAVGNRVKFGSDTATYVIISIASKTSIMLDRIYEGTTASGISAVKTTTEGRTSAVVYIRADRENLIRNVQISDVQGYVRGDAHSVVYGVRVEALATNDRASGVRVRTATVQDVYLSNIRITDRFQGDPTAIDRPGEPIDVGIVLEEISGGILQGMELDEILIDGTQQTGVQIVTTSSNEVRIGRLTVRNYAKQNPSAFFGVDLADAKSVVKVGRWHIEAVTNSAPVRIVKETQIGTTWSVTTGSAVATTNSTTGLAANDYIRFSSDTDRTYRISAVNSSTQVTLVGGYEGTSSTTAVGKRLNAGTFIAEEAALGADTMGAGTSGNIPAFRAPDRCYVYEASLVTGATVGASATDYSTYSLIDVNSGGVLGLVTTQTGKYNTVSVTSMVETSLHPNAPAITISLARMDRGELLRLHKQDTGAGQTLTRPVILLRYVTY
jgi:hypothetical protein